MAMEPALEALLGKVAIITGASTGIGAATAIEFARKGALLCLSGRNEETLTKLSNECKSYHKKESIIVLGDLTVESTRVKIIEKAVEAYGRIDVLVNNAGGAGFMSFGNSTLKDLDESYDMNVRVPYHLSLLALPYLKQSKGNIINISSVASKLIYPTVVPYCINKAALDQFTKCIAVDLGQYGIRVNSINPGAIRTENAHRRHKITWDEYLEIISDFNSKLVPTSNLHVIKKLNNLASWHALQRVGDPKEIARLVAFVASDAASFVTGSIVMADGGACLLNVGARNTTGARY